MEGDHYTHFNSKQMDQSKIKSVVGAGDSFLGGFVVGLVSDQTIENCVELGQTCAIMTLQSEKNVSPSITAQTIV